MKRARRFPQRLVRWTSLCVCFALVLTSFVLFPSQVSIGKNARSGKPSAKSGAQGNGQERRVTPPTPKAGPPKAGLPNLDDLRRDADDSRRHGPREVHAPPPVPSTRRRWKHERERASLDSKPVETKANHARTTRSLSRPAAYMPQGPDGFAMARLDPHNRTGTGGVDLLSNNFNWSLGLLGLKGRGGLDLGLSLSYNSLVWTRSGNYIKYDLDDSTVAPGFRLDFPVIEGPYWNDQAGTNFYLMVTPSGARVELRYTGTANTFESQDSAHLQLQVIDSTHILVRPTDGTRMSFTLSNSFWRCNEIKDRNGNYLTITHNSAGDLSSVTDTLNRTITVTYDGSWNIQTIDQTWNGQTHHWATFVWGPATIGNNFSGLSITGPNNTSTQVLRQVGLPDSSYYTFEYGNGYGQVTTIRYFGSDARPLRYTTIAYSTSGSDPIPRVSERHEWADWWNGMFTVPSEAVTYFAHDGDGGCRMTLPDGTVHKEYYGSTWQSGLTTATRDYETVADANADSWKKRTSTTWTQDALNVSYLTNPRVTQMDTWDIEGNHRKTTIYYGPYEQWSLPYLVHEFVSQGGTDVEVRQHYTDYVTDSNYLNRRIIGLVSAVHLTNVAWFQSKVTYLYDEAGQTQSTLSTVQHDPAFDTSTPRGNVTSVSRWDTTDWGTIVDGSKALTSRVGYDTNGSPVWSRDAAQHQSNISYTDSFSADGFNNTALSFATFAYPTTITDADGNSSTMKYHYDFGAATRTDGPLPAGQSQGAIQTTTYDSVGRLSRTDNLNNGAYARWDYGSWVVTKSETIQDGAGESHTVTILDGFGRAVATGGDNPGSTGGGWAKFYFTDVMGRPSTGTNPEEITGAWVPTGDDEAGWLWGTPNTYDWKGRPLRTYNMDGTYKTASYGGCGCAGGEVVMLTDEMGRKQNSYADPLGRTYKVEVLNDSGTVYSTTASTFNARDQVTAVNTYKGSAASDLSCPSGTCMQSVTTFDGYGRTASQKQPQQSAATTYAYNADDTVSTVTDPRSVVATNAYNGRHLLTGVSYTAPGGISTPSPVSFGYDAVGNRTAMSDGTGTISYSYNQLSRLTSETRTFTGLSNSYTIGYSYNLGGELTNVIDPSGAQASYNYDSTGRLTSMPASGYTGVTNFLTNVQYRAFGGMKHATYGNSVQVDLSYNSRMQIGQYQASGFHTSNGAAYSMGATMSYYNDGRTNTAFDLNDSKFDRKYDFDFSARLKEAYSGVEAHGQAAPPLYQSNSPYRQSYTYDEYSDVLTRSGRMWTHYDTENGSYTSDNKRQGWSYDNAGNALTTFDGTYTYDAAGRPVSFASFQTWKVFPDWPSSPPDGPALETHDTFDGTGQLAKHVNTTRLDETIDYGDGNFFYWLNEDTTTTYYVHSTALGGKTIAEVSGYGNVGDRFVYSGGARIATYHAAGYTSIEATNPVTGAVITTDANASNPQRQEPDPLGRDLSQPPVSGLVSNPLGSGNLKDRAMPIEASWGPSAEFERGNAWWANTMDMMGLMSAINNKYTGTVEAILRKNPNVGIGIRGGPTLFGQDAANYINKYEGSIDHLPWTITSNEDPLGMETGPQKPAPGSFQDCFHSSGLANTSVKGQYANGTHFTQDAANLLLDVHNAEGTSLSLLAVTLMNENTAFDLKLKPNTNNSTNNEWWDIGPFQINQHYAGLAISRGTVSRNGLDLGQVFGIKVFADKPFAGVPLANGRFAARELNSLGGSDREKAITYAQREGRGASYDSFGPLFDKFFNCYGR